MQSQHKYGNVVLGFTETATDETNAPEHFASKAGGKPTWLYRWPHIGARAPHCKGCGEVEVFLGQVYAPIEEGIVGHLSAFHRVLYITVCTTSGCSKRCDGIGATVLRGQLARKNPFYLYTAEEGKRSLAPPVKDLCVLCGFWGELACGGCHAVRYCSKRCQRQDWSLGHRNDCRTSEMPNQMLRVNGDRTQTDSALQRNVARKQWRLAELEIATDRHPTPPQSDSDEDDLEKEHWDNNLDNLNEALTKKRQNDTQAQNDEQTGRPSAALATQIDKDEEEKTSYFHGTMQDADEDEIPEELFRNGAHNKCSDDVHTHFNKVVAYEPDQVVRYERGGRPLWASVKQQCDSELVPQCERCGEKRVFEMQLMPQIVYMLEREKRKQDANNGSETDNTASAQNAVNRINEVARRLRNDMDWATIVLFTCAKSCPVEVGEYVKEFAWVQRHT